MLETTGFRIDRLFVAGGVIECLEYLRLMSYKHLLRGVAPPLDGIATVIDRSHGSDHGVGMTVFAAASREDARGSPLIAKR